MLSRSSWSPPSVYGVLPCCEWRDFSLRDQTVRVQDELLARTLVEILVAGWRLVERDDGGVDRLGDLDLVVEDRLHETAVVLHHRRLPGGEGVRLRPAEADADLERPDLGVGVDAARIAGDVEAGDAERRSCP